MGVGGGGLTVFREKGGGIGCHQQSIWLLPYERRTKSSIFIISITFNGKFHRLLSFSQDTCGHANIASWVIISNIFDLQCIIVTTHIDLSCTAHFTPSYSGFWIAISWAAKRGGLVLSDCMWGRRNINVWSRYGLARFTFRSRMTRNSFVALKNIHRHVTNALTEI